MNAAPKSLHQLNARVADDLSFLALPAAEWVPAREVAGQPLLDVAVIGGGMAGLAATAVLGHTGLRTATFDASPEGFEGPWATTARMETLRSPKTLTGPALGIPSLTFRAWYTAQFGTDAWEKLDKIPRLQWMDYLRWYREVLGLEIRNDHRITDVRPMADHVGLDIDGPDGTGTVLARHVVLATGRDGLGGPVLPSIAESLPRSHWVHSSDVYDYDRLAGKKVAVIGAGASAMDSAGTALEAGAASVELLIRRKDIPRINYGMAMGNPGAVHGMGNLPDDWRWKVQTFINGKQVPPPHLSVLRVSRHTNAYFRTGCALKGAAMDGDRVRLDTVQGPVTVDFVIFATGFRVDWSKRPFLHQIAGAARSWSDRLVEDGLPYDAERHPDLLAMPDLGPAFEFLPRPGADLPGLGRVHCFCYPAVMSHGNVSGDIPAISEGARRLARGIASSLYVEDIAAHFAKAQTHDVPELNGDEWVPAPLSPAGRCA